jgi:beta-phosphoglucomutase-like phosphatase (HAD superfamily)
MIRAFVFDLDGTMVETEELKALSYSRAAAELRTDLNEGGVTEAFKELVGLWRQEVAVGLMRRIGLEGAARTRFVEFGVDTAWQAYVQMRSRIYETLVADPELVLAHGYPHNIALLCDVRREDYPTALATQSHLEQARRVLDILGLADEFDVVVARDDVEHSKPDPEMPTEVPDDHATRQLRQDRENPPAFGAPSGRTAARSRSGGTERHAARKDVAVVRAHTAGELPPFQVPLPRHRSSARGALHLLQGAGQGG